MIIQIYQDIMFFNVQSKCCGSVFVNFPFFFLLLSLLLCLHVCVLFVLISPRCLLCCRCLCTWTSFLGYASQFCMTASLHFCRSYVTMIFLWKCRAEILQIGTYESLFFFNLSTLSCSGLYFGNLDEFKSFGRTYFVESHLHMNLRQETWSRHGYQCSGDTFTSMFFKSHLLGLT